jgi:hypothetical protein
MKSRANNAPDGFWRRTTTKVVLASTVFGALAIPAIEANAWWCWDQLKKCSSYCRSDRDRDKYYCDQGYNSWVNSCDSWHDSCVFSCDYDSDPIACVKRECNPETNRCKEDAYNERNNCQTGVDRDYNRCENDCEWEYHMCC